MLFFNTPLSARYYANVMGRFMTPDWAAKPVTVPYAEFGDPQSWNRYAYAGDDPINSSDPSGQFTVGWEREPRFQDLFLSAFALAAGEGQADCSGDAGEFSDLCPPMDPEFTSLPSIVGGALNSPDFTGSIGSLGGTIHNILSEFLNIDTCPAGTFECPTNGAPLFGTPTCDPLFCMSDVTSANSSPSRLSCLFDAVKTEGIAFGTDVLGAIPGEGQALAVAQLAAGGVGFVNSLVHKDPGGAVGSILGDQAVLIGMAAKEVGVPALKAIPVAGNLLSGFLAIRDVVHGVGDYNSCLGGN